MAFARPTLSNEKDNMEERKGFVAGAAAHLESTITR